MKNKKMLFLLSTLLLASCNNVEEPKPSSEVNSQPSEVLSELSSEKLPSETLQPTEEVSSVSEIETPSESEPEQPSESEPETPSVSIPEEPTESEPEQPSEPSVSEPESPEENPLYMVVDEEFEANESLFDIESINLAVGETYNLSYMINNIDFNHKEGNYLVVNQYDGVVGFDNTNVISGVALGTTKIKVVSKGFYDEITINVLEDEYMDINFTTDLGRLANKSFTVFGDSITDITTSAYSEKQDFWCEQLVRKADMTMYNYAKSGSTTGVCQQQVEGTGAWVKDIMGTTMVRNTHAKADIQRSDYVFIFLGNNDFSYRSEIGTIGEVTDENYWSKESFKGAYSYIISKIREYNPEVRIVCMGLSTSTWGYGADDASKNHAKTREQLANVVGIIADELDCKFINMYGLWTTSQMNTYCSDGIHPLSAGYDLMVEKILNS